ncbi:MAG: PilZ domain-containing protein [Tepidisphaeraceae bacterium]
MELPLGIYEEITGLEELPPPVDETDHERRKHRRVPWGCRVTVFPERKSGDNTPGVAMVRDMSVAGLSILTSDPLKPPTPFVIEFKGRQDRPVKIRCISARCEAGGFGATQFVVGATFDQLLTTVLSPEELHKEQPPPEPLINLVTDEAKAADEAKPVGVNEELIEEALREPAGDQAEPALELMDKESQEKTSAQMTQPEHVPTATPDAPPPPPGPAKAHAALFQPHSGGKTKKLSEIPEEEPNELAPAPAPQAAVPPPEESAPVFRVIPIPQEPEKAAVVAMELGPQAPDAHGKDHHEVLVRVKELLVQQEQLIERQRQELKEHRERSDQEIESMRSELEETKRKLAELQTKAKADDSAIADLANFLKQHGGGESPAQTTEAA